MWYKYRYEARRNPARLSEAAAARAGSYFADWIMEYGPDFLTRSTTEDVDISTTFDPRIQNAAEEALAFVFETKVREGSKAQAAIVVMSPDGAVRAMVGGRKAGHAGQFNRATQALRQTGSAFKPFVYATALEQGWPVDATVEDKPLTIRVPGSGNWSPKNYDNSYHGLMTLTEAFARSINTVAVRVSEEAGRENVKRTARGLGVTSKLSDGPALALGVSEMTLLEITGAYAGILNGGSFSQPHGIRELRLRGDSSPLFGATHGEPVQVIGPEAAGKLTYMMREVVRTGSGARAALPDRESAGKTGTTQGARDAWFIGFTADYVAGVWMGYDDNSKLTGVTGSGLPSDIWRETMSRVHDGLPRRGLPLIEPVKPIVVATPSRPSRPAQPAEVGTKAEDAAGSILRSVLRNLLGTTD
jgi:membrane peptidoglycan carboxypeptidase